MIAVIKLKVGTFLEQRLDQKEDVRWYSTQFQLSTRMATQLPLEDNSVLSSLLLLDLVNRHSPLCH